MAYDYNRHRRKRIQSEQELTLAQMMRTVLIETGTPSGAFFAYENDVISNLDTQLKVPVITVRPGTFTSTPSGLTIDSATGTITPNTSTEGEYEVTIDIGAAPNPGEPEGTYTQTITLFRP